MKLCQATPLRGSGRRCFKFAFDGLEVWVAMGLSRCPLVSTDHWSPLLFTGGGGGGGGGNSRPCIKP